MSQSKNWTLLPQECSGDYYFNGRMFITKQVASSLSPQEIHEMLLILQFRVIAMNGLDYLQVFENEEGDKIFIIDQLSQSMLNGDGYSEQEKQAYHYATMLFSHEY